jgi:hypothetical protein
MQRRKTTGGKPPKRPIDRYEHTDKKRINNPPVGLVTPETDPVLTTHKFYDYVKPVPTIKPGADFDYDPHLDPQLVWAGKKEHRSFEVPTVSLHVHERIDSGLSSTRYASVTAMARNPPKLLGLNQRVDSLSRGSRTCLRLIILLNLPDVTRGVGRVDEVDRRPHGQHRSSANFAVMAGDVSGLYSLTSCAQ